MKTLQKCAIVGFLASFGLLAASCVQEGPEPDPESSGPAPETPEGEEGESELGVEPQIDPCIPGGALCGADFQCCSGDCNDGVCQGGGGGQCKGQGQYCSSDYQCCSGDCVYGTCQYGGGGGQCKGQGQYCSSDYQCCSGECAYGTCQYGQTGCRQAGQLCGYGSQCCSGFCVYGVCALTVP